MKSLYYDAVIIKLDHVQISKQQRRNFDSLLSEIISQLPENIRSLLKQIPVIVEDEPSEISNSDDELLGTYEGIPETQKSLLETQEHCTVIFLYRGPILRHAEEKNSPLKEQIQITLLHEIAHHFGFDDEYLEKIGYG